MRSFRCGMADYQSSFGGEQADTGPGSDCRTSELIRQCGNAAASAVARWVPRPARVPISHLEITRSPAVAGISAMRRNAVSGDGLPVRRHRRRWETAAPAARHRDPLTGIPRGHRYSANTGATNFSTMRRSTSSLSAGQYISDSTTRTTHLAAWGSPPASPVRSLATPASSGESASQATS